MKSVNFRRFVRLYASAASHTGNTHVMFRTQATAKENADFPPQSRHLNWGIEKGGCLKNSRPKRGYIQVICYSSALKTVDITGFFKKFCITTRTSIGASIDSLAPTFSYVPIRKAWFSPSRSRPRSLRPEFLPSGSWRPAYPADSIPSPETHPRPDVRGFDADRWRDIDR